VFDVEIWGTAAAWTGALLSGLSILAAVVYYVLDRERERRAQAASVIVWLHPHEHGPPFIKMMNLSDKPIFDYGCIIEARPKNEIERLDPKGMFAGPFEWPQDNELEYRGGHSFLNYHDGSELYLAPGASVEHLPQLDYNPMVYKFYADFRDASGKSWVIDADTQRAVRRREKRRLRRGNGPDALRATRPRLCR
jgi:hypothetical protein